MTPHGRARAALAALLALTALASGCRNASSTSREAASAAADAGTVYLRSLSVTAASSASATTVTLIPAFAPSIHDYYVRCAAGTNALEVAMEASSGAKAALAQPTISAAASSETIGVSVAVGGAIVATATAGSTTVDYWVRCLPPDFPPLELTRYPDSGTPSPGYYLVGNTTAAIGASAYAMVLDGNGVPVWYDATPYREVFNVSTVAPGVISFIAPNSPLGYQNHELSPLRTTYVTPVASKADEHELQVLPNGDFLLFDSVGGTADLTGLTLPLRQGGTVSFGPGTSFIDCVIREITPSGTEAWSWKASDHFDLIKDMSFPSPPEQTSPPYVVEPFHCNSIDVDVNGNLLVSARHMNSVFYVERPSGKVLWKMGGATYSKDDASYVPVSDPFVAQHDARFGATWTPSCSGKSGRGQISLFDDESSVSATIVSTLPGRGVVYDVNVAAPGCGDAGAPSATVAWQYAGTEPVSATGSFRVLPEGGGIVGWGTTAGFIFSEVAANGDDLLDLNFTDGTCSYRAIKVPLTALDLDVMHATAGLNGPLTESSSSDAGVDAASHADATTVADAAPREAGTPSESGASDGGAVGCSVVSGSGASAQCAYTSSAADGFTCASVSGSSTGSCPPSGLYGCCVELRTSDGGFQTTLATCYYSSTTGQPAASECATEAYDGLPYEWQTTLP